VRQTATQGASASAVARDAPLATLRTFGACAAALALAAAAEAADLEHGKEVFRVCAVCHTEKSDSPAPSLKGILGRRSAALDDFRYSNSMIRADLIWDEANLREYLADPQAKVRGNRMAFMGLENAKDIEDVIAYLATLR
jgi:cytochrome c